jgi:hypothetical protein
MEAVMTYFKLYSHHLFKRTTVNYKKPKLEEAFNSLKSNKKYSQCMTTRHLNRKKKNMCVYKSGKGKAIPVTGREGP